MDSEIYSMYQIYLHVYRHRKVTMIEWSIKYLSPFDILHKRYWSISIVVC